MATGIVLFGHGSRDPLWRLPIEAVRERIRGRGGDALVECAYLELTTPSLANTVDVLASRGVTHIRIVPMFLGVGRHAREDLPVLVEALRKAHPAIEFATDPAVGEREAVIDLLATVALGG